MPIYAYQCESCGFAKDILQKLSDPQLAICPACSAATFKKQLTSAGFHLKGSGWYATDFKAGSAAATDAAPKDPDTTATQAATTSDKAPDKAPDTSPSPKTDAAPAKGGCCNGCACH